MRRQAGVIPFKYQHQGPRNLALHIENKATAHHRHAQIADRMIGWCQSHHRILRTLIVAKNASSDTLREPFKAGRVNNAIDDLDGMCPHARCHGKAFTSRCC